MPHRTTPCDVCDSEEVIIDESFKIRKYKKQGKVIKVTDLTYSEFCGDCSNLLYGHTKNI